MPSRPARFGAGGGDASRETDHQPADTLMRFVEQLPTAVAVALTVLALALAVFMVAAARERRRSRAAQRAALSDPLTGLPNRLAFEHRLATRWQRALREGSPLGVLMVDLDEFKQLNDSRGHAAGDELLRRVADGLREQLGRNELAARLGGDEFGVVTSCAGEQLAAVGGRLQRSLGATGARASVGWAELRDRDADAAELVKRADLAMYRQKARRSRARAGARPAPALR